MPRNPYHMSKIRATLNVLKKWNKLSLIWKFVRMFSLMNIFNESSVYSVHTSSQRGNYYVSSKPDQNITLLWVPLPSLSHFPYFSSLMIDFINRCQPNLIQFSIKNCQTVGTQYGLDGAFKQRDNFNIFTFNILSMFSLLIILHINYNIIYHNFLIVSITGAFKATKGNCQTH